MRSTDVLHNPLSTHTQLYSMHRNVWHLLIILAAHSPVQLRTVRSDRHSFPCSAAKCRRRLSAAAAFMRFAILNPDRVVEQCTKRLLFISSPLVWNVSDASAQSELQSAFGRSHHLSLQHR